MDQSLEQILGDDIIASIHSDIRSHPIHPETPSLKRDVLNAAKYACQKAWSDLLGVESAAINRVGRLKEKLLTKSRELYTVSVESGSHPTAEYQESVESLMTADFNVTSTVHFSLVMGHLRDLTHHFGDTYCSEKCDDGHLFLIPPEFRHLYIN